MNASGRYSVDSSAETALRNEAATARIIPAEATILVTGANGFIGSRVVRALLLRDFRRIRCLTRSTTASQSLAVLRKEFGADRLEVLVGNLLSPEDCLRATEGVSVIYHLAAGIEKTFPGCFLNSVVTTRNLLDAAVRQQGLKRFVNVSSLAVYSNAKLRRGAPLDETCEVDTALAERYDPYAYAKAKQDAIVLSYAENQRLPYVIVRPGVAFGPGKAKLPGRVGTDTFGLFLHLGLNNRMPLTYVTNCADAIVLAGLTPGVEGEVINVVDDDLPTSRHVLRMYKQQVRRLISIPIPYRVFYVLSHIWEAYSRWSEGQLPPAFNRKTCSAYFKGNTYSNKKAKSLLGWHPRVHMGDALQHYFAFARKSKGSK